MKRIAIFASGKGSNADSLCTHLMNHATIKVELILSDRKEAGVFAVAEKHGVKAIYLNKELLTNPDQVVALLKEHHIDVLVLAGYLKLVPKEWIAAYSGKVFNLHPALLPKFGGKGMYGMHVHRAVAAAGETETGITIHEVNEHYDEGKILFQARTSVEPTDSPERIAEKIAGLEKEFFAKVIVGEVEKMNG
jgi:phosphoribosylglycinamide formyltransferase-1